MVGWMTGPNEGYSVPRSRGHWSGLVWSGYSTRDLRGQRLQGLHLPKVP
jgi:hypothetical protein